MIFNVIINPRWEETSRFAFLLFKITQCRLIQIYCYQMFFLEKSVRVDGAFPPLYTISPINELPKLSIPTTV